MAPTTRLMTAATTGRAVRRAGWLPVLVLAVAATAGCSAGTASTGTASPTSAAPSPSAPAPAPSPTTTPAPSPEPAACGPASGQEAAASGIAALPAPAGLEGIPWDAANADYSGYDPCAALSWSLVTLEGATASTPTAVLLFHSGSYLGTATEKAYGFTPTVERTADDAIAVTYRFLQGSESNAEASGRATATLTWNAATGSVDLAGDLPPTG
ncbi:LppP/LprE family lipoprotein [Herbiconiux sp. VKM Ac-2851]|uniref:LppP/LprE family lipoprotein n=1 Tax=Herbiconiux sp. VKM Ac-2851 TaxID=2739025 RepID=UPI001564F338|nr:LppP/LprE family lipoprotein [Herbiconiux sp. VKM Ac-2851]NQX35183.1 LppP/LprE family lipoprotein [Herbiconiux sp. VKM Ac-2851]